MKKTYYLIKILFLTSFLVNAQTADRFESAVKEVLHKDQYFADFDFFDTSVKDSLSIDNQFKFAETARRMYAFEIAEAGYQRVIRMDALDERMDYPVAIYQAGKMKKLQGKYEDALLMFETYLSSPPPVDNLYLDRAKRDIEDCRFALERTRILDNHYRISHMGTEVNSSFNDFAPMLVDDQFYFSSLRYQKKEKLNPPRLFAKTLTNGETNKPLPLQGLDLGEQSLAHLVFNKDQQRVYFTICDYPGKSRNIACKIYYRNRIDAHTWSPAQALPSAINRKGFTVTHPTVAYDKNGNELLIFSSNRPGGKGKMDIWVTRIDADGFFSTPVNFSQINTAGNDLTPFYHFPSNTLYFSSDGREGLGGLDIYSYTNGEINHGGYPLNSSFNDTHFFMTPSGDKGYISSSRNGCLRLSEYDMGCQDIFEIEFINIDLEVTTFDKLSGEMLTGTGIQLIQLTDTNDPTENQLLVDTRFNTLDHQFQFDGLIRDARYRIIAKKEGYISDTLDFNTRGIAQSIDLRKKLYLSPDIFSVNLAALTFDKETRMPLENCIVQLIDLESGERYIKDNLGSNDFYFDIFSQKEYRIIANLIGYSSDTLDFNTKKIIKTEELPTLSKRLYLNPGGLVELSDFLPLTLYFDNDHPDPKRKKITTSFNYEELYAAYYRKKGEYVARYTEEIKTADYEQKLKQINHFFENDLRGNYDTLGVFSETLIRYLQRGNTAVISIRGFASPLAGTGYNINLGKRRVDCLMNHFYTYRDGMLMKYIEEGTLLLQEVSFGESKAPEFISENPKDRKNSVYSPEASRERKVQIVEISVGEKSAGE